MISHEEALNSLYHNLNNAIEEKAGNVKQEVEEEIKPSLETKFDSVIYNETGEDYMLKFYSGEEELAAVKIEGGGGGGGGSSKMILTPLSDWRVKKISSSIDSLPFEFYWSSTESDIPTGAGIIQIYNNEILRYTQNIQQGNVSVNLIPYLNSGANNITIKIIDIYDMFKVIKLKIEIISLNIESNFIENNVQTDAIEIQYIPYGSGLKTVYFKVDNNIIGTQQTQVNGVAQNYILPMQSHGSHKLDIYYTTIIDNVEVESNILSYNLISVSNSTPIIASIYNKLEIPQYTTVNIPFYCYNPISNYMNIGLKVDDQIIRNFTVDRSLQYWEYTFKSKGNHTLEIYYSDTIKKVFNFNITESQLHIEIESANRDLYLSAQGRSNQETNPAIWKDENNNIECQFNNFNFITNGWLSHSATNPEIPESETVLRISNNAELTIPIDLYKGYIGNTGKTIEFELAVRDVKNYNTPILFAWDNLNNAGLKFTAQDMLLKTQSTINNSQWKDNEFITVSFVIGKYANQSSPANKIIYTYINGVMSGATQALSTEQLGSINTIVIGGTEDATVDIARIRIYHNDLNRTSILTNWIADKGNVDDMISAYNRNDIFDDSGNINISKLPSDLPYIIITGEMPPEKGQKKEVNVRYIDPSGATKNFTFNGASIDVQGTSSKDYPRKNWKIKFKKTGQSFEYDDGTSSSKYTIKDDVPATNVFTFKKDVASSDHVNNTCLAMLYNDISPYKFPKQIDNPNLRQGIYGIPCVMFWDTQNDDGPQFYGTMNMNLDKGSNEAWGFSADNHDQCFEFLNNADKLCTFELFKNKNDYTQEEIEAAFEFRFDPYAREDESHIRSDYDELMDVISWVNDADDEEFKNNFANWFEKDAVIFYYVFTHTVMLSDNRAKNQMLTKYGSNNGAIGTKWFFVAYDFDTSLGIDNSGNLWPGESYAYEDDDIIGGVHVFNGWDSLLWQKLKRNFSEEIKAMYYNLRNNNKFTYNYLIDTMNKHQSKWPEAMWSLDSYLCYINPLIVENETRYLAMALGKKQEQRKYFWKNRLRYFDSKYIAGESYTNRLTLRSTATDEEVAAGECDLNIKTAAKTYLTIEWAKGNFDQHKAEYNELVNMPCIVDKLNDQEIYIYNLDAIKDLGDLSGLKPKTFAITSANQLTKLQIGNENKINNSIWTAQCSVANAPLLETFIMSNNPGYNFALDLTNNKKIKEVYMDNTGCTSVQLPINAPIETLILPNTITTLQLEDLNQLSNFVIPSTQQIRTLIIKNISKDIFDTENALNNMHDGAQVQWIGASFGSQRIPLTMNSFIDQMTQYYNKFHGIGSQEHPDIRGEVWVQSYSAGQLATLHSMFPDITLAGNPPEKIVASFYQEDTIIKELQINKNTKVNYASSYPKPIKESSVSTVYTWDGWNDEDGYTSDLQYNKILLSDRNIYAHFAETIRKYVIKFMNGSTVLQTSDVNYNALPEYTGETPVNPQGLQFTGWSPEIIPAANDAIYSAVFKLTDAMIMKIIVDTISSASEGSKIANNNIIIIDDELETHKSLAYPIPGNLCKEIYLPKLGQLSSNTFQLKGYFNNGALNDIKNQYHLDTLVVDIPNFCLNGNTSITSVTQLHNSGLALSNKSAAREVYGSYIMNYEGQVLDLLSSVKHGLGSIAIKADTIISYHKLYCRIICDGVKKLILPKLEKEYINSVGYTPKSLEYIDFGNLSSLNNLYLTDSVNLKDIYLRKTDNICTLGYSTVHFKQENLLIHVPEELIETYKTATNWIVQENYYQETYGRSLFIPITEDEKLENENRILRQEAWMEYKQQCKDNGTFKAGEHGTFEDFQRMRGEI